MKTSVVESDVPEVVGVVAYSGSVVFTCGRGSAAAASGAGLTDRTV